MPPWHDGGRPPDAEPSTALEHGSCMEEIPQGHSPEDENRGPVRQQTGHRHRAAHTSPTPSRQTATRPRQLETPGLARRESYVPSSEPGAAHILTRQRAASQDPTRQTRRNTRASSSRASRDTDRPSAPGTRTARPIRTRLNTRRFTANTERSRMTHTVRGQSRPPHLDQPGKCWRGHTS